MLNIKRNHWLMGFVTCFLLLAISTLNAFANNSEVKFTLKAHPLPNSLVQWEDLDRQGDYFASVTTTPVDYLVWSQFPVKVYVEPVKDLQDNSAQGIRTQQWVSEVRKAIAEWNLYLPLQEVSSLELADIAILRSSVSRDIRLNPDTGLYDIPQAITAQTNYEFYLQEKEILAHKMTVKISPDLSRSATLAAARHELGHSLGIWGHSDRESDALYFSQVKNAPRISARDINTLKKIYQQPTKLGWQIN